MVAKWANPWERVTDASSGAEWAKGSAMDSVDQWESQWGAALVVQSVNRWEQGLALVLGVVWGALLDSGLVLRWVHVLVPEWVGLLASQWVCQWDYAWVQELGMEWVNGSE